jgi:hypothetical protein
LQHSVRSEWTARLADGGTRYQTEGINHCSGQRRPRGSPDIAGGTGSGQRVILLSTKNGKERPLSDQRGKVASQRWVPRVHDRSAA